MQRGTAGGGASKKFVDWRDLRMRSIVLLLIDARHTSQLVDA